MPTTLELIKDDNELLAVLIKLAENKIKVVEADTHGVTVETPCGTCNISWECCGCHGGRMWFDNSQMHINIELSNEEYDESIGVVDMHTELAYYIDNKMVPTILSFNQYIYTVTEKGKYGMSSMENYRYFTSCEEASRYVFGDKVHRLDMETGTVVRAFPNALIKEEISYIDDTEDGIHFACTCYKKEEAEYTYDIYYKKFRKKKA